MFHVVPVWTQIPGGAWSPKHKVAYVMAAEDVNDAARQCFAEISGARKKRHRSPDYYTVWRVMTPEEFRENVGVLDVDRDENEDLSSDDEFMSNFLLDKREVRL